MCMSEPALSIKYAAVPATMPRAGPVPIQNANNILIKSDSLSRCCVLTNASCVLR